MTIGQKLEGARMLADKQVMVSGRHKKGEIGLGSRVLTPPHGMKAGKREGVVIELQHSFINPKMITHYMVEHDDLKEIQTYRVPVNQVKLKKK